MQKGPNWGRLDSLRRRLLKVRQDCLGQTYRESEIDRLESLPNPDNYYDELKEGLLGVLLSDKIKLHSEKYHLIDPLSEANLKPAAYELRVGSLCSIGGRTLQLSDAPGSDSQVVIPPFEVVVIQTAETLNMPRYLIARWNLRVHWAYEGLLWVGGAQVDPGYKGYLFCPLYNLSNKEITLKYHESVAAIDFVPTTPVTRESQAYELPRIRKRIIFDDYKKPESALYSLASDKIDRFGASLREVQGRVDTYSVITFAAIAILVTALAAVAGRAVHFDLWNLSFLFAVAALCIQLGAVYILRTANQLYAVETAGRGPRNIALFFLGAVPAALACIVLVFWIVNRLDSQLNSRIDAIQAREIHDIGSLRTQLGDLRATQRIR